jgi:hypothetical protein
VQADGVGWCATAAPVAHIAAASPRRSWPTGRTPPRCSCSTPRTSPAGGPGNRDDHGRAGHRHRPVPGLPAERRALGHRGPNWLFFGDQHRSENFYYRDELHDMGRRRLPEPPGPGLLRDQARRCTCRTR